MSYIHSKFLLMDPLGDDPIVVTGSANFSDASTNDNDENMLIIRGDQRVADIYFTEFNRLFNHYYFRSVQEETRPQAGDGGGCHGCRGQRKSQPVPRRDRQMARQIQAGQPEDQAREDVQADEGFQRSMEGPELQAARRPAAMKPQAAAGRPACRAGTCSARAP